MGHRRACPSRASDSGVFPNRTWTASTHVAARIIGFLVAPLAHERLEFGIAVLRQRDAHSGEEIALPALVLEALALETEGAAAAGAGWNGQFDRARQRRNAHLAAEHRLVERDRQLQPQIGAVAREQRMR